MNKNRVIVVVVAALGVAALVFGVKRLWDGGGSEGSYNVLLITLDTTRADHVGCYGYEAALTPAMDKLAARGVVFDQVFCSAPMTLPSHATILSGLQPPEHGVRMNGRGRFDLNQPMLAEQLRGRGYQTAAFIASYTLEPRNGLNRGFDLYEYDLSDARTSNDLPETSAYRAGDSITDATLAWLGKRREDQPFFCWVHLFDPHLPYWDHESLSGTRYEGQAGYDAEIAFMDQQVGRLLAYLEKEDLTETTLVVAVGDHGEGLGEHGEKAHGYMVYETTLRVPMIVSQPGRFQEGLRVGALVSLVDVYPTILDLIGVEGVDERSGRSLSASLFGHEIESVASYAETNEPFAYNWSPLRSLTTPRWKYIRSSRRHLYDRQADPKELDNLAIAHPDKVAELEKQLRAIEDDMEIHVADQFDITPEAIQRLEALGYVDSGGKHFDTEEVDYASLQDIEDMLPVLEMEERSHELGRARKFEEQIVLLQKMIKRSPESPPYRRRLAYALNEVGRKEEAFIKAREYLKLRPDDQELQRNVGVSYMQKRDYPAAVRHLSEVIRMNPNDKQAHEMLARILRMHDDPLGAVRHIPGMRSMTWKAVAHYDMGVVLLKAGRFQEAVDEFEEALHISPDDLLVRHGLAKAFEKMGDITGATQQYYESIRIQPCDALAHRKLGIVSAKQGRFQEALKHFSEVVRVSPDDALTRFLMAGVLEAQRKTSEAIVEYREALRIQPDWPQAANSLAWVLATHHNGGFRDGAEAVKLAEHACQGTEHKDPMMLDTLAAAYAEVGRFEEAVETAHKALAFAEATRQQQLAQEIQDRLTLYESRQAYYAAP